MNKTLGATFALLALVATPTQAAVRITEWMYNGAGSGSIGEFVELTNLGSVPVDMTGWSFDDDSHTAGSFSLSAFGTVAPHESVVLTDNTVAAFKSDWGLSASVKVIGGNDQNLSRNDEINIYDASNALVDQLTYGDQNIAGTIRTNAKSGHATTAALGAHNVALWAIASAGDSFGSHTTAAGDLGNPGSYPVPEPASVGLALVAFASACLRRRSR